MQECDLGQQSVLHAIRSPHKILNKRRNTTDPIEESISEMSDFNDSGSKPMNETLMDLPLDETVCQHSPIEDSTGIVNIVDLFFNR